VYFAPTNTAPYSPVSYNYFLWNRNRSIFGGDINFPVVAVNMGSLVNATFYYVAGGVGEIEDFPVVNISLTFEIGYYNFLGLTFGVCMQIVFAFWCMLNMVLSVVFITRLMKRKFVGFLAYAVLLLEFLAQIPRLILSVVDPFYCWAIWPINISSFLQTYCAAASLAATWLIAVFWAESSFKTTRQVPQLVKHCFVVTVIVGVFLLEYLPDWYLASGFGSATDIANALLIRAIVAAILYFLLSAFFIISGCKVLYMLYQGSMLQGRKLSEFQKYCAGYIVIDSCIMTALGCLIFWYSSSRLIEYYANYGFGTAYYVLLLAKSTNQIIFFRQRRVSDMGGVDKPLNSDFVLIET
jgi:hypothetical protein